MILKHNEDSINSVLDLELTQRHNAELDRFRWYPAQEAGRVRMLIATPSEGLTITLDTDGVLSKKLSQVGPEMWPISLQELTAHLHTIVVCAPKDLAGETPDVIFSMSNSEFKYVTEETDIGRSVIFRSLNFRMQRNYGPIYEYAAIYEQKGMTITVTPTNTLGRRLMRKHGTGQFIMADALAELRKDDKIAAGKFKLAAKFLASLLGGSGTSRSIVDLEMDDSDPLISLTATRLINLNREHAYCELDTTVGDYIDAV